MTKSTDLYEVLQVSESAEPEVIEAAYKRLARMYHPDVNASPDATRRMQELNDAYRILGDPQKRAAYDRERKSREGEAREQGARERPPREPETRQPPPPPSPHAPPRRPPRHQWRPDLPSWRRPTPDMLRAHASWGAALGMSAALLYPALVALGALAGLVTLYIGTFGGGLYVALRNVQDAGASGARAASAGRGPLGPAHELLHCAWRLRSQAPSLVLYIGLGFLVGGLGAALGSLVLFNSVVYSGELASASLPGARVVLVPLGFVAAGAGVGLARSCLSGRAPEYSVRELLLWAFPLAWLGSLFLILALWTPGG